ncbi:ROK family protein [Brevibacterium atlanticum]|uniref:ROK family protein n=1 Tax=Brevibacterium atlanticum TaxID=2697563 RepID=UPI001421D55C|nr:ROK family protein [Brevibacterium atlanticum]
MTTSAEIMRVAGALSLGFGPVALAVDVGGTGLKAGLFDSDGSIIDARTAPTPVAASAGTVPVRAPGKTTPKSDPTNATDTPAPETAIVEAVAALRDNLAATHPELEVGAAAVVVPGIVEEDAGIAVYSANLGWRNAPMADLLERRLGCKIVFGHDVRAAGLAEFAAASSIPDDAALITIGTGIAGAVQVHGRMVSAGGYAGELGFLEVAVDTAEGRFRGPVEHIASAAAIARRYAKRSGRDAAGAREVLEAMRSGDAIAAEVFAEAADALGAMCAQLVTITAPSAIVLGGGLSGADELIPAVAAAMRARLSFHREPEIRAAGLGAVAGLIGAGLLTRRRYIHQRADGSPQADVSPQAGRSFRADGSPLTNEDRR